MFESNVILVLCYQKRYWACYTSTTSAYSSGWSCVGVDILKLPLIYDGYQYVLVFLDYRTKWVEAFPIPDQKVETVAEVLVEEVISRHGASERLLSE